MKHLDTLAYLSSTADTIGQLKLGDKVDLRHCSATPSTLALRVKAETMEVVWTRNMRRPVVAVAGRAKITVLVNAF